MTRQIESEFFRLYNFERKCFVDAELRNTLTEGNVDDWRNLWIPRQVRRLNRFLDSGGSAADISESFNWNWDKKVYALRANQDQRGFSIVCEGVTEAMMIVDLSKKAKLLEQQGQNLVYIEFIHTAPWNERLLSIDPIRFKRCGTVMVRKAIRYSTDLSLEGRIGLHSLKGSEGFYKNHVKMCDWGKDFQYGGLRYFEMTPSQSESFLTEGDYNE